MNRMPKLFLWVAVCLGLVPAASSAATLTTLYSFCSKPSCTDGNQPTSAVVLTPSGDVLGGVLMGGKSLGGVFDLRRIPGHKNWHESMALNFCRNTHCKQGDGLFSGLTADAAGNVYGETQSGGRFDDGVVFKLTPDGKGGWLGSNLYNFCRLENCLDGNGGDGAMVFDTQGNIYGAAFGGGTANKGVVYELSPPASRDQEWTLKVLYNFCAQPNCADGNQPLTGVTYAGAASGAPYDGVSPLYGTTSFGGNGANPGSGVVFSLTPHGGAWQESVLYSFCPDLDTCAGGNQPAEAGSLSFDAKGNIYGATQWGGTDQLGHGVLYELSRKGGTWNETVLHTFCQSTCGDGAGPSANPIMDAAGNLFGTVSSGVAYELVPGRHPALNVLYTFCALANCADGEEPNSVLAMDADGNLFGTTQAGGAARAGTVFELTP
jgi:uncharacterized repeat protein (TIGR03803 family)